MTALARQVEEAAERMAPAASVALTVGAWVSLIGFGLMLGLVVFMVGVR